MNTRQWVIFIDAPMTQPVCVINGDAPKVKPLTQMVRHYGFPIDASLAHGPPFRSDKGNFYPGARPAWPAAGTSGNCGKGGGVMGEAEMKGPWGFSANDLTAGLKLVQAEGQGVWALSVIYPEDTPERMSAALMAGNREAAEELRLVLDTITKVRRVRSRRDGPLCALCDTAFWRGHLPHAIAILRANGVPGSHAVASGICIDCRRKHMDHRGLLSALVNLYRRTLILDLRVLPPMAPPGQA
jgi:hypothetical protein